MLSICCVICSEQHQHVDGGWICVTAKLIKMAQYPPFNYNSGSLASSKFYCLCDYFDWERDDPDHQDTHEAFKDALVKQFKVNFGTNTDDLTAWQGLCASLGMDLIPDKLAACCRVRWTFIWIYWWFTKSNHSDCWKHPCQFGWPDQFLHFRWKCHDIQVWRCIKQIHNRQWSIFSEGECTCKSTMPSNRCCVNECHWKGMKMVRDNRPKHPSGMINIYH